ncbi:MAG: type II secretion system protein [Firmicutes bacterium]|nr:type II secretion system protein [Bacillota bacterium]
MKNRRGFTLIELLVAMTIMGILLVITMPRISGMMKSYEKKKYETYAKSVERAAKLYVESHSKEMFGHQDSGCVAVTYNNLKSSNLIRDYNDNGKCNNLGNGNDPYVNVRKIGDQYEYDTSIECVNKSGKEMINQSLDNVTCDIAEDKNGPILTIDYGSVDLTKWINLTKTNVKIKVKLEDNAGFWANQTVKYYWRNVRNNNKTAVRVLYYQNKREITPKSLTKQIPSKYFPDSDGEWELVVQEDISGNKTGIKDYLGNSTTESKSIVLKIDNNAPSVPTSEIRVNNSSGALRSNSSSWTSETRWWGNFNATDSGSGVQEYQYSSNCDGNASKLDNSYTYNSTRNWTFCIRAVDHAGNASSWSSAYYFKIDKTAPTDFNVNMKKWSASQYNSYDSNSDYRPGKPATSDNYSNNTWYRYPVQTYPSGSSDADSGGVYYQVTVTGDSSDVTNLTTDVRNIIHNGTSTVKWRACDAVGNCTGYVTKTVKVDKSAPTVPTVNMRKWSEAQYNSYKDNNDYRPGKPSSSVDYSNNTWYKYPVQTYPSGSSDSHSGGVYYQVTVTGDASNVSNHTCDVRNIIAGGTTKVKWRACDAVGNCSSYSSDKTIKVDKGNPSCSITKTSTGTSSGVSVSVSCSDSGSGVDTCAGVSGSSASKSGLTSPTTYTVVDNAGRSGSCSVSVSSTPHTGSTCIRNGAACTAKCYIGKTLQGEETNYNVCKPGSGFSIQSYYEQRHEPCARIGGEYKFSNHYCLEYNTYYTYN